MFKDPNPDNLPIDPKEKSKRRFALLVLFIVIIGGSVIFFILNMRKARLVVKDLVEESSALKVKGKAEKKIKLEERKPQHIPRLPARNHKSLVPSKRDQPNGRRGQNPHSYALKRALKYRGQFQEVLGQTYAEVENIIAIPLEQRDQYGIDDIIAEKNNRLLIYTDGVDRPIGSMGVVHNIRTKRLGLLTGTLKIIFFEGEEFEERSHYIREPFVEKRTFPAIRLSLIEPKSPMGLVELQGEKTYWQGLSGIKSVEIEIIETNRQVK
jgi:hypothetical protein